MPNIESAEGSVVVASFRSGSEAEQARGALAAQSIEAALVPDGALGSGWLSIAVSVADAESALRIIESLFPSEATDAYEAAEKCPRCSSSDVGALPRLVILLIAAALLLPAGLFFNEPELFGLTLLLVALLLLIAPNRRCRACGERWTAPFRVAPERAVETRDVACPRCGSDETSRVDRRREKAITLLVNMALPPLVVIWPFLPKRKCTRCGHEWR